MYLTCGFLISAKQLDQPWPVSPSPCRKMTEAVWVTVGLRIIDILWSQGGLVVCGNSLDSSCDCSLSDSRRRGRVLLGVLGFLVGIESSDRIWSGMLFGLRLRLCRVFELARRLKETRLVVPLTSENCVSQSFRLGSFMYSRFFLLLKHCPIMIFLIVQKDVKTTK